MPWQLMLRAGIEHLGKSRRKTETTYIARVAFTPRRIPQLCEDGCEFMIPFSLFF